MSRMPRIGHRRRGARAQRAGGGGRDDDACAKREMSRERGSVSKVGGVAHGHGHRAQRERCVRAARANLGAERLCGGFVCVLRRDRWAIADG